MPALDDMGGPAVSLAHGLAVALVLYWPLLVLLVVVLWSLRRVKPPSTKE